MVKCSEPPSLSTQCSERNHDGFRWASLCSRMLMSSLKCRSSTHRHRHSILCVVHWSSGESTCGASLYHRSAEKTLRSAQLVGCQFLALWCILFKRLVAWCSVAGNVNTASRVPAKHVCFKFQHVAGEQQRAEPEVRFEYFVSSTKRVLIEDCC